MKVISDSEYAKLTARPSASEVTEIHRRYISDTQALTTKHEEELVTHKRDMCHLEEDHVREMKRKDAEQDIVVQKATKALENKVSLLTIENESNKKEVDILTKAFKNLGFDVKDMKDILNKLVDGLVSKNQIQLVK